MRSPAPADLQRWSEDLARDPASLAFLPLAKAYRRQGQRDAALRLCLRGLEQHPTHVEAHALLALLYLEGGDRERACDEWSTVLSLDPSNFDAHRGMGFHHLEQGDTGAARRHLERAAAKRPDDPAVREALVFLREQQSSGNGRAPDDAVVVEPPAPEPAPEPEAAVTVRDPGRLFEPLLAETPFRGALVLDAQGLVMAGTLAEGGAAGAEALGAILGGAVEEATRAVDLLKLGGWRGILLETERAMIHLAPLRDDLVVLVAADRSAPTGWVMRTAQKASQLAQSFLEAGA